MTPVDNKSNQLYLNMQLYAHNCCFYIPSIPYPSIYLYFNKV
jgi:hypothetical protein